MEILWTWSQTLEGFAMVPQYVCSYRNTESGPVKRTKIVVWVVVSIIFYFHPYLGKIHMLTNIFQMG